MNNFYDRKIEQPIIYSFPREFSQERQPPADGRASSRHVEFVKSASDPVVHADSSPSG
jgi:hypothetical protein